MSKIKINIMGGNLLEREAVNLPRALSNNDKRVQSYLVNEIIQIEEHRNPTRLNAFFARVKGSGIRTHAMHAFMQAFANIRWDPEREHMVDGHKVMGGYVVKAARDKPVYDAALAKASATMWTTFKSEGKVIQFDLETSAFRFLQAAFKAGVDFEAIEIAIEKVRADAAVKAKEAIDKAAKVATKGAQPA